MVTFYAAYFPPPAEDRGEVERAKSVHLAAIEKAERALQYNAQVPYFPIACTVATLLPVVYSNGGGTAPFYVVTGAITFALFIVWVGKVIKRTQDRRISKASGAIFQLERAYALRKNTTSFETHPIEYRGVDERQLFSLDDEKRQELLKQLVPDQQLLKRQVRHLQTNLDAVGWVSYVRVRVKRSHRFSFNEIYVAQSEKTNAWTIKMKRGIDLAASKPAPELFPPKPPKEDKQAEQEDDKANDKLEKKEKKSEGGNEKKAVAIPPPTSPETPVATLYFYNPSSRRESPFHKEFRRIPTTQQSHILAVLEKIKEGRGGIKPVAEGAFLEVHAGSKDDYRIYFKKLSNDRIVVFSISEKQKQDQAISNVRSTLTQFNESYLISEEII